MPKTKREPVVRPAAKKAADALSAKDRKYIESAKSLEDVIAVVRQSTAIMDVLAKAIDLRMPPVPPSVIKPAAAVEPAVEGAESKVDELTPEEQALIEWMNNSPELYFRIECYDDSGANQQMDITVAEYNYCKEAITMMRCPTLSIESELVKAANNA